MSRVSPHRSHCPHDSFRYDLLSLGAFASFSGISPFTFPDVVAPVPTRVPGPVSPTRMWHACIALAVEQPAPCHESIADSRLD